MIKKFRLYTDYGTSPLWGIDDPCYNFTPADLPISQELIDGLNRWQATYDATLADYPPDSGFSSPEAKEEWYREGIRLWVGLQQELGSEYEIYYSFAYEGEGRRFTLDELPDELKEKWLKDMHG